MTNYYHLLVETPERNLVAGMEWLQGARAHQYDSRHGVFGHLFQGRYKALVVDGQAGRRGWYLGAEGFSGRQLKALKPALARGKAAAYSIAARPSGSMGRRKRSGWWRRGWRPWGWQSGS